MSRSFAVWGCRNYTDSSSANYNGSHVNFINELHINFWNVSSHDYSYLDFGITFKVPNDDNIRQEGAICIFIPFIKNSNHFTDLSKNLEASDDLVTAVFNEYLIERTKIDERHLKLNLTNKGSLIINTKLTFDSSDFDKRIHITQRGKGTLIVCKLKDCLTDDSKCDHYIRLRIQLDKNEISGLVKTFYPADMFLKSNIERSDIIDFRINEQRNLPNEISTTLASAACTPLKCHLFIIRDLVDDCSASGSNYKGCRILESETWKKYFEDGVSFGDHDPMIYHWKIDNEEKSRLNDFSIVVKFKNTRTKKSKIFAYLFYGAALTYLLKLIPTDGQYKNYLLLSAIFFIIIYLIMHAPRFRK